MIFCTNCGNRLEADLKFCTHCGAPVLTPTRPEATGMGSIEPGVSEHVPQAQAVAFPDPPQATGCQASPVSPLQQHVAGANSGCMRTALIAVFVLALVAVLGVGGMVYVGLKMKQKATAILHKAEAVAPNLQPASGADGKPGSQTPRLGDSDAADVVGNLTRMLGSSIAAGSSNGENDGDPVPSVSDRDPVEPCGAAPFPPQSGARIPLQTGTVITTSWGVKYQDVEGRISIDAVTPQSLNMSNKTDAYKLDNGREEKAQSYSAVICNEDIASSGIYETVTGGRVPHLVHGVVRLRLSDKSFNEVRTSGKINFDYLSFMEVRDGEKPNHDGGLLTRVEPQDVPYPMIVNDERVTLPTIHLAGITDSIGKDPRPKKWRPNHSAADLYVLDDPADPLVLLWKIKDPLYHEGKFRVEVVKIDFKTQHPVNVVEKQLTEQKRAITYGIYFDFNKDTIKSESEPVLKQIVQAMLDNPTWKLTVEGHTDNIGGDSYNLDLSRRRAAAVKQALVARYRISPDRLSTDGFGASRPVETNDTLEGRARNRRVELTRE
jgi:outer membrane protein OmpA-like peptidoglycan-associated protein